MYWLHNAWITTAGEKMSKSLGNVVRPLELQRKYGNDAFRYYLLRDMNFGLDASFSESGIAERINSDLANDLGNLLNRTVSMTNRYLDGERPAPRSARQRSDKKPSRIANAYGGTASSGSR